MVENPEVAGHDLVLQHGPGGDVDPVPVVGDDDHRAPETHWQTMTFHMKFLNTKYITSSAEGDIAGHCEMIQLQQVWYWPKPRVDIKLFNLRNVNTFIHMYLDRNDETFLKWESPSLTRGVAGNIR